jgi:hypothetical protein
MDRILHACSRPSLAEDAVYQYARGGTDIDGPSIRLAEAIAQNWGNILSGVTSSLRDKEQERVHRLRLGPGDELPRREALHGAHWRDTKQGGYALKDERDIYELCANMGARRKRACILAIIPGDVTEAAVSSARSRSRRRSRSRPSTSRSSSLVGAFEKFGVTKEHDREAHPAPHRHAHAGARHAAEEDPREPEGRHERAEDWFDMMRARRGCAGSRGTSTAG